MSDSALFMLAFDHRKSIRPLFGIAGEPDADERARIGAAKEVVYEGLLAAAPRLPAGARPGLLVDEEFGTPVLERARETDVVAAVAVERSGQVEFQFEYEDFAAHLEKLRPELAKALVRYNVGGDRALNDRQLERLRMLSDRLGAIEGTDLLFELLVPPTDDQLAELDGNGERFDAELRPALVVRAIEEIQDAGIEVAIWKIEGVESPGDCDSIAAACRRDGRSADCLILGRGADESKVEDWLSIAAPTPGFGGFAVGRTIWWDAIAAHLAGEADRPATVETIAGRYLHFVDVYLSAGRSSRPRPGPSRS
jgi:myo-inositol catabolism protein IolC